MWKCFDFWAVFSIYLFFFFIYIMSQTVAVFFLHLQISLLLTFCFAWQCGALTRTMCAMSSEFFMCRNIPHHKFIMLHICNVVWKLVLGTQQLQLKLWIGLLNWLLLLDICSVQSPDLCGLDVCQHNAIIIYVHYNYCANNLMSQSCYEGGFRLLLPLKWDQMLVLFYIASRWPRWLYSVVDHSWVQCPSPCSLTKVYQTALTVWCRQCRGCSWYYITFVIIII